jgi:hypothetical protein
VIFHDVSELRGLAREMSYQASHDALTGLVNRTEFEAAAAARGAEECLLEVAVTNAAALALYVGLGYSTAGWRPAYYRRPSIEAIDALVLRKHPITLTEKPLTDSGR